LWDFTISGETFTIDNNRLIELEVYWCAIIQWPDEQIKQWIIACKKSTNLKRMLCIDELKRREKTRRILGEN